MSTLLGERGQVLGTISTIWLGTGPQEGCSCRMVKTERGCTQARPRLVKTCLSLQQGYGTTRRKTVSMYKKPKQLFYGIPLTITV